MVQINISTKILCKNIKIDDRNTPCGHYGIGNLIVIINVCFTSENIILTYL